MATPTPPPDNVDNDLIQKKCQVFLESLGIPGFIVFGWQKPENQFGFVYSNHKVPPNVVVKGMAWALNDFAGRKI